LSHTLLFCNVSSLGEFEGRQSRAAQDDRIAADASHKRVGIVREERDEKGKLGESQRAERGDHDRYDGAHLAGRHASSQSRSRPSV
jgi:hypothetical protein